jgi:hypothetical protein
MRRWIDVMFNNKQTKKLFYLLVSKWERFVGGKKDKTRNMCWRGC